VIWVHLIYGSSDSWKIMDKQSTKCWMHFILHSELTDLSEINKREREREMPKWREKTCRLFKGPQLHTYLQGANWLWAEKRKQVRFGYHLWTHKYITLLVFRSHVTPLQLHGSASSGLHKGRIPSELTIAFLKLQSASPTKTKKMNFKILIHHKCTWVCILL
jgi:hypothetical protein